MPVFAPASLSAWTGGRWTTLPARGIAGFGADSRALEPGELFVALKTDRRDGHDFLPAALDRGAAAALVARETAGVSLPQLVVPDPLTAFQSVAREHRRLFRGPVVGVTGSAGKTSTKDLLTLLLGGPATVHATPGNLNNFLGIPLTLTRLDPGTHRAAVVEAGINQPAEMATLAAMIEPTHGIVTLVAEAHLEKLGSLEGVAAEKSALLRAVSGGGVAVFPASCWRYAPFRELAVSSLVLVPAGSRQAPRPEGPRVRAVEFSVRAADDTTELSLEPRQARGLARVFRLRRVSEGMAQNAALALALASELGVGDDALQRALAEWRPAQWRGELRRDGQRLIYLDCYNANPASLADALGAFEGVAPAGQPRLFILGSMEELGGAGEALHREAGARLRLGPRDAAYFLGTYAEAYREGALRAGASAGQLTVADSHEPIAERAAAWSGAVFAKGSRRWQLERIFGPPAGAEGKGH